MKKFTLLIIMSALMALTYSCTTSANDDDGLIVCPEYPAFSFDNDGIPYRYGYPTVDDKNQEMIKKNVIGYGWKRVQIYEIGEDGYAAKLEDVDSDIMQKSFYFKTDTELIKFFHAKSANLDEYAYLVQGYTLNALTGTISDGGKPNDLSEWSLYMRVYGLYEWQGTWCLSLLEPLYQQRKEDGTLKMVWGCIQYVRMSDAELQEMQKKHVFDYSVIN